MSTATPPVLVIGSMALDDLQLPSGNYQDVVGGAATFAALAASFYSPSGMVGIVGQDFPEASLEQLRSRQVDTSGVVRAEGQTFKWVGRYAADLASRETLDTRLNVFADFSPVLPEHQKKSPYVLLGNIHPALQKMVLDQLEAPRFVLLDTMNFWIEGERAALTALLPRVDCLVINDEELRLLSGVRSIVEGAAIVRRMGPSKLIVKKGEHGALLFDGEQLAFIPAFPLQKEMDPTGAGDTFAGALLGKLAQLGEPTHDHLRTALAAGAVTASYCVEGVGMSRLLKLEQAELQARSASLLELARLPG